MNNGNKAMTAVLPTNFIFDLLTSNSKDPSKTINTKPTVPKIGKVLSKFGISKSKKLANSLATKPSISSKITDGIFVLDALISKIYANKSKTQKMIIIVVIDSNVFRFLFLVET